MSNPADIAVTLTAIVCAVIHGPNGTYRYSLMEEKPSAIGVAWSFPIYKLQDDLT